MKKIQAPLLLGNWKMNFLKTDATSFFKKFLSLYPKPLNCTIGFAAPFTLLDFVKKELSTRPDILIGSQNIHWLESGAHTGEISAPMLNEIGIDFAIVGHSERRTYYGENDHNVSLRAKAAIANEICPIICIGENESEFKAGKSEDVVLSQLRLSLENITIKNQTDLVIAYEPVWAIGTGLSAKPEQANKICELISEFTQKIYKQKPYILYGGSADNKNVSELISQEHIDGFLVGGASMKPEVFSEMILQIID